MRDASGHRIAFNLSTNRESLLLYPSTSGP